MRANLGLGLLYVVTIAIILGGVGDLVIREPLEVHRRFLLGDGDGTVSPQTASLVVHLLHALGGGLVGVGTAALAMLHYGLRRGQRWAGFAVLGAVVPAETMNAVGMNAVNSFYYVSVAYLVLVILGVALVLSGGDRATLTGNWGSTNRRAVELRGDESPLTRRMKTVESSRPVRFGEVFEFGNDERRRTRLRGEYAARSRQFVSHPRD